MSTQKMLAGKVIVVTGAGRGIGRAIAIQLAAEGASVVVNDLGASPSGEGADATPAEEVVAEIRERGGQAIANTLSVAEWDNAHEIIAEAIREFGRIDGVVNNAGILRDTIFHKMTEEQFDIVLQVHLKGSFNMSRACAPHFREQQSGCLVHMTSTSALIGNLGQANYMAAKLGIVGLSKSIALDMARYRVRSNCISPFAWSRLFGKVPTDTPEQQARVEKIKQMTPEKIAPLAAALFSDAAADISGQIFAVRNNEIFLMSQPRPIRSAHTAEGWTPESVCERVFPAFRPSMYPLDVTANVFSWDPV
ncbi:MAG: SDR family oxidoreductase [Gammaproteobacteria bacterium]|nr:MAG: SDR family oxidoreductase [Gammaproteobacteria bacterium]